MGQPHTIEVEIDTDGRIHSEVHGIKGSSCQTVTAWLDGLGKVEVDKKTSDDFKDNNQAVVIKR